MQRQSEGTFQVPPLPFDATRLRANVVNVAVHLVAVFDVLRGSAGCFPDGVEDVGEGGGPRDISRPAAPSVEGRHVWQRAIFVQVICDGGGVE
eukprot:4723586-Pleurochrysis_carterae.AAC.1